MASSGRRAPGWGGCHGCPSPRHRRGDGWHSGWEEARGALRWQVLPIERASREQLHDPPGGSARDPQSGRASSPPKRVHTSAWNTHGSACWVATPRARPTRQVPMGCFPGGERRGKRLVGGFYQLTKRVASNCTTHPRTVPATPRSRDVPGGGQLIWTLVCQVGMVRRAAFRSPSSFCAGVRGAGVRLDGVVSLIFEGWVPHDPGFEAGLRCLGSSVTRGLLIAVPRVPATAARPTERSRRKLLPARVRRWLLPR